MLNPVGSVNYNWNYSNPNQEGFSTTLVGTVIAIQEVQAMNFDYNTRKPTTPAFWQDGNPKMNIRLALALQDGSIKTFTFQPASRAAREGRKPSIHMDLFKLSGGDMLNLITKTIQISTENGTYGMGNPRPWHVQLIDNPTPYVPTNGVPAEFNVERILANTAVSGGQMVQLTSQQAPMPQQTYQQPVVQQPVPQPAQQVPMINPQIMAGMQAAQPTSVTVLPAPQPAQGQTFGDDMPF